MWKINPMQKINPVKYDYSDFANICQPAVAPLKTTLIIQFVAKNAEVTYKQLNLSKFIHGQCPASYVVCK